jgi:hypothetical protein
MPKDNDKATARKVQPGDILDTVITLRELMARIDAAAYILLADFSALEGGSLASDEIEKARRTLELASTRLMSALTCLERLPCYTDLRKQILAQRQRYRKLP